MKLAALTSSRADWGLLEPLVNQIEKDNGLILELIVTGSHFSELHGMTYQAITYPYEQIEINLASDSEVAVAKAMGLFQISFAEILERTKPGMLILLGDRYETISAAIVAQIARIPIVHIHGGELSGNYDNVFRWCISEMSYMHFTACQTASYRLKEKNIQGKDRIYCVGSLGVDGLKPVPKSKRLNNLLIVYHPNTIEKEDISQLFIALSERPEPQTWIMPNADNKSAPIRNKIKEHCRKSKNCWKSSLKRKEFIKMLSCSKAIVGNSSAGIIEAPALKVPTINIGTRQNGRDRAGSIIDCDVDVQSIRNAFAKTESKGFKKFMKTDYFRPYFGRNVAKEIVEIIKKDV